MLRVYRSIEEAWQAFDVYARLEPRLRPLWDLCRRAAPPVRETAFVDDVYNADPLEIDQPASGSL